MKLDVKIPPSPQAKQKLMRALVDLQRVQHQIAVLSAQANFLEAQVPMLATFAGVSEKELSTLANYAGEAATELAQKRHEAAVKAVATRRARESGEEEAPNTFPPKGPTKPREEPEAVDEDEDEAPAPKKVRKQKKAQGTLIDVPQEKAEKAAVQLKKLEAAYRAVIKGKKK